jgi:hypothetical protein
MSAQLARMTQVLIISPSTWNVGTTTELHQGITFMMAEAAKAADKTNGEEGEADVGKRRV